MPVKLKFDAFPFQDHGTVTGKIIVIAPEAQVDERSGSFYKVIIAAGQTGIIAKGKNVPLRPGLTLTAELITERKSILDIILEPIRKLKAEVRSAA
jgi:membrane fusion protein, hemolysin D